MRSARTGKYPPIGRHCAGGGSCTGRAGLRRAPAPALAGAPGPAARDVVALAECLLRRTRFTPAPGQNVIAASWPLFYARLQLTPDDAVTLARRWWAGPALLQTLFALEHEAVRRRLAAARPRWPDRRVHAEARAVTAAMIHRIHLREWCRALVPQPVWRLTLRRRRRAGERQRATLRALGPALAPPLPDRFQVHSALTGNLAGPTGGFGFLALHGPQAARFIERYGAANLWYSLGVSAAGAFTLRNHPLADCRLPAIDGSFCMPLAADIGRQRDAGCARFNDLRRCLGLAPAQDWSAFAPRWGTHLARAYASVDAVDALIGLLAERRAPFCAVGETTLRCLLAGSGTGPRRLCGEGLRWVKANSLRDVLLRHYPVLQDALYRIDNPFLTWRAANLIVAL